MEILILCGIYLVELACYCLGLRILFEVHYRTKVWMALGILVPVVVGVLPIDDIVERVALVGISVIVIAFFSITGKILEKGAKLVLIVLLLECLDGIFVHFCEQVLEFYNVQYLISLKYLMANFSGMICVLLLNLIMENVTHKKTHINSGIYYLIAIIAAAMMYCLAILNHVKNFLPNDKYILICNVLNIVILFSVFLLVVFIVYIKNTHEKMEQLLKTEQLMKELQVNYYKQMLKKENDTRKYRHDMVNHLTYVRDILAKNKVDDAKRYLSSILGGFRKIQNTYYVIGNEMIEIIMNYFFGMLPKGVKIEIRGKCPVVFNMEETDVCTIFSNLFQNAVEEIIENGLVEATIIIEVHKGIEYVEYNIKNTMVSELDEKSIDNSGLPKSHKLDKQNHGIGMLNVKNTVERNYGKFKWKQNDGYFCVDVILPIK